MSLREKVQNLHCGTIFQVGQGTPWMRTATGVADLLLVAQAPKRPELHVIEGIPYAWDSPWNRDQEILVLYVEDETEEEW